MQITVEVLGTRKKTVCFVEHTS